MASNLLGIHAVFGPAVTHQAECCAGCNLFLLVDALAVLAWWRSSVTGFDQVIIRVVTLLALVSIKRHMCVGVGKV